MPNTHATPSSIRLLNRHSMMGSSSIKAGKRINNFEFNLKVIKYQFIDSWWFVLSFSLDVYYCWAHSVSIRIEQKIAPWPNTIRNLNLKNIHYNCLSKHTHWHSLQCLDVNSFLSSRWSGMQKPNKQTKHALFFSTEVYAHCTISKHSRHFFAELAFAQHQQQQQRIIPLPTDE